MIKIYNHNNIQNCEKFSETNISDKRPFVLDNRLYKPTYL